MIQMNWFVGLLGASGLAAGLLAVFTLYHKRGPGSRELTWLMAALSVWALMAAFEGAAYALPKKIFWSMVSYTGVQTAPVLLFLFILKFTRSLPPLHDPRRQALLFIFPAVSLLITATNDWHGWIWPGVALQESPTFGVVAVYEHGPWFWLMVVYNYLLVAASFLLLFRALVRFPRTIALQVRGVLAGAFIPWLLNVYYLFGPNEGSSIDLTPVAFIASCFLLAWTLFQHGLLELSPIARDAILENLVEGVLVIDHRRRIVHANPAFLALFKLAPGWAGKPAEDVLAGWPELCMFVSEAAGDQAGSTANLEFHAIRDPEKWFRVDLARLPERIDSASGYLVSARDISARKRGDAGLLARQRFLHLLNEITQEALQANDQPSMLQSLADRVGELLGADAGYITLWDEKKQMAYPGAASGEQRETYQDDQPVAGERTLTRSVLEREEVLVVEDVFNTPYISPHIVAKYPTRSIMGLPMIAGGRKLGAVLIGFNTFHRFSPQEIALGTQAAAQISLAVLKGQVLHEALTARKQAETNNRHLKQALEQLHIAITTDRLTGAFNRSKFDQDINQELGRVRRYGHPLALIMFDIDHFKRVNDTFGHTTGDQVLIEMVSLIEKNIRTTDMFFRWGGEEFFILSPGIELDQAASLGLKILRIVAQHPFSKIKKLTVSMGITNVVASDTADTLLARVDRALYQAKNNGRNRVEILPAGAPGEEAAGQWQEYIVNENEP